MAMLCETGHRRSVYSAASAAMVYDHRRASWQPVRPLPLIPVQPSGPRLSTSGPARIATVDGAAPRARNIAPKVRIVKNVLVLSCCCMCSLGGKAALTTYLGLSGHSAVLAALELSSAVSCLYGGLTSRKLTYKATLVMCQVPLAVSLGAVVYGGRYSILPTALLVGLFSGPLWNASLAYLTNSAAHFAYFSYQTREKMVKRFWATFHTIIACGWSWAHLVTAGAFGAIEHSNNASQPTAKGGDVCGAAYCGQQKALIGDWPILPVSAVPALAGSALVAAAVALFLLDKVKVQLCSQTNQPTSPKRLLIDAVLILADRRVLLLLPMFVLIGLQEAFVQCQLMQAYVWCVSSFSTVGYVMFSYGLVSAFMTAFLCPAVSHIRRATVLLAGAACQLGSVAVMLMWKPAMDDKPVLYVLAASLSISQSIWSTVCPIVLCQCFPDKWEAPFGAYYAIRSIGAAAGYLACPFWCQQYKIYGLTGLTAMAIITFAIGEIRKEI